MATAFLGTASGVHAHPRSITTSPDGTVHADGLDVPVSEFLSPEARAAMIARLAVPGAQPKILAKFPPTLLVTGTRDTSMSNALATHVVLLNAGIETSLLVRKGVGKADFTLMVGAPEAKLAYNVISRFFDQHLAPDHSTDSKRRESKADRASKARTQLICRECFPP